ncbi:DUF642 domain-containing protein [Pelomonas sp. CA6]|uniref:PEP-CTERM sorting domain-containing protein n=1 Tax=Pelomonas sp. CA6 TaxID=2907999 RepID=UPI001F4B13EB|nr:PEP-CTERM sorting domain-containing protein [Pelomonas sp. CA6]MCH7341894.1 DUF642 domain-containing protein [Pelomonas sp. CA6]
MTRLLRPLLPALLATAPLFAQAAPTNLLVNGSFEANVVGAGSWITPGSISGWSVGSQGVELRNGISGQAQDGFNFAELDTSGNSSIWQSFSTVAGVVYDLSFYYSSRPEQTSVGSNGIQWSLGGLSGVVGKDLNTGWQLFQTQFTGTGSAMTLNFKAVGTSDSLGTSLDNVRVSAVPEPQSLALALSGLGMLGLLMRRRRAPR